MTPGLYVSSVIGSVEFFTNHPASPATLDFYLNVTKIFTCNIASGFVSTDPHCLITQTNPSPQCRKTPTHPSSHEWYAPVRFNSVAVLGSSANFDLTIVVANAGGYDNFAINVN